MVLYAGQGRGKNVSLVKYSRVNCAACLVFHHSKFFKHSLNNRKYQVLGNCNFNCSTSNLVYLITCNKSDNQYVEETKQKLTWQKTFWTSIRNTPVRFQPT